MSTVKRKQKEVKEKEAEFKRQVRKNPKVRGKEVQDKSVQAMSTVKRKQKEM